MIVRYEHDRTMLSVDNGASAAAPREGMGGGHGLEGLRERIERAGGTIAASSTPDGWRARLIGCATLAGAAHTRDNAEVGGMQLGGAGERRAHVRIPRRRMMSRPPDARDL